MQLNARELRHKCISKQQSFTQSCLLPAFISILSIITYCLKLVISAMNLNVKHGGHTIALTLPEDVTLEMLQTDLESQTGILVRKQKLLASGKVISGSPGNKMLQELGVKSGGKLMLMAAPEAVSAGAAALQAAKRAKQDAVVQHRQEQQHAAPTSKPQQAERSIMERRVEVGIWVVTLTWCLCDWQAFASTKHPEEALKKP